MAVLGLHSVNVDLPSVVPFISSSVFVKIVSYFLQVALLH